MRAECWRSNGELKAKLKIGAVASFVMAEESAELKIVDIRMDVQRVEVIRQVQAHYRYAGLVFGYASNLLGYPDVDCEVISQAGLVVIRDSNIIPRRIEHHVKRARSILDTPRHAEFQGS